MCKLFKKNYYFFMDKEATDNTKEWCKALVQYKGISGWTYIENFLLACRSMFENKDTKLLTAIRNEEVHNVSPLELITYKFQEKALIPIPTEYILTNQELHNKIVNASQGLQQFKNCTAITKEKG